jgi:hypothetical protein
MLTFLHLALRRIAEPEIPSQASQARPDPQRGKMPLAAPIKPVRRPSGLRIVESAPAA